jgi:hypothetical protein
MKRKAAGINGVEEIDDDLYDSDNDDEEIRNLAKNLNVFCVSSTEYQKIKNTTMDDGPPTVSQ